VPSKSSFFDFLIFSSIFIFILKRGGAY